MQATQKTLFEKRATAEGGYWRSPAPKEQLRGLMRSMDAGSFKQANIGGDQESGFEQAFASLAYAYLKDKSPRLLDFIVGFQLVDRNEDNTKAVGVFGFKVGDQWLYAPVFFLNGDLKGHELLYIKKQDAFVPMKENWVNYLISRKPHVLGEGSDRTTHQLGGLMPNLSRLSRPQMSTKYGSDEDAEEERARESAKDSILPHVRDGMHSCKKCGKRYYSTAKAKSCCGDVTTARGLKTSSDHGGHKECTCGLGSCKACKGVKKAASENLSPGIAGWAAPFVPLAMSLALKQAKALYHDLAESSGDATLNFAAVVADPMKAAFAPTAGRFDMRNALADFPLLKSAFENCYRKFPLIKAGFDRFYGPDFFLRAAESQKAAADSLVTRAQKSAASYIVPPKKKKPSDSIIPEPEEKRAGVGLSVFLLDGGGVRKLAGDLEVDEDAVGTITDNLPELDDAERARLLKDTVLIKDERDPHGKSVAYNTQVRIDLANPDQTGLFDVLEKPGKFDEMVVLVNPHSGRGRENFCTVVRKGDSRAWKNCDRSNVYAKQNRQPTDTDYKKWVDGLGGVETLKEGGVYVALGGDGGCTAPFRVRDDLGDGQYRVEWKDSLPWSEMSSRKTQFGMSTTDSDASYSPWDAKVWINKRKGSKLRAVNGELSVPDSFKILKLKDPPKPRKGKDDGLFGCLPCSSDSDGESEESPIMPGGLDDVQLMLHKEASRLKITDGGANDFWLPTREGSGRMTKRSALVCLVRNHGISEAQASEMLKAASSRRVLGLGAEFLVKYADGYPSWQGPSAPAIPEPPRGTEQNGYESVAAQYPQEEFLPVDEMSSQHTDPSVYDPFYQPDRNAMQVAQQASQSGQKEVFDTAMISGMLKSVRQDSLVDKHLGDLMKALDKLGRILFMFYWHQEEFEDRYGKRDLPELEDSLRNAYEVLGDVTLFLREKTVQGAKGLDMGSSVGPGNPDPDVDEAARN